jgi:hypothetical protein
MKPCPGCGLELPVGERGYDRKFHASAECWSVFEEVLAAEFQNPALFGQVHQLTVDAYAVQHAGGRHPDKSVCIHLVGLFLMLERSIKPVEVPPFLQRLARRASWPHLAPPEQTGLLTVYDVAIADSPQTHALRVREWAEGVWRAWAPHHDLARQLAETLGGSIERVGAGNAG